MGRVYKNKTYYLLYVLIILSSVGFFNPFNILPPPLQKALFYGLCALAWCRVLMRPMAWRGFCDYPEKYIRLTILGLISSVCMACLFHEQTFMQSFISTLPALFGYLTLPLLVRMNIRPCMVMKAIWCFVGLGMIVYLMNFATLPNMIFGGQESDVDDTRGVVRISIPFIIFFPLLLFYSIQQWTTGRKDKKWLLAIIILSVFIVLSVTRQIILLSFVLGCWIWVKNLSLTRRIVFISAIFAFSVYVLPEIPIYKALMELSENQVERNADKEEDIRIQAWRFYTVENQTNSLSPIFGNGIPSKDISQWGREHYAKVELNRCFTVDVGWAGFFWLYGGLATFGLLMLFYKAIKKKCPPERQYLKYWLIFIAITSAASGPILFYNQIISICTGFYLFFYKENY